MAHRHDAEAPTALRGGPLDEEPLRITELAERTGASVRNIRFYTQLGILPRPVIRGRQGWYEQEHVDRLGLVQRLRGRGYSLAAIADMVDGQVPAIMHGDVHRDPATAAWDAADPDLVTLAQLHAMVPELAAEPGLVDRAVQLGLLVPAGPTSFSVPQPPLLRAGIALVSRGVPVQVAFDELARLREEMAVIAGRFSTIVHRDMLSASDTGLDAELVVELLQQVWPAVLVAIGRVLTDEMHEAILAPPSPDPAPRGVG
ncbi:MAG: MerR family transcriptional regulator [Phycicoccus sp.]